MGIYRMMKIAGRNEHRYYLQWLRNPAVASSHTQPIPQLQPPTDRTMIASEDHRWLRNTSHIYRQLAYRFRILVRMSFEGSEERRGELTSN